MSGVDSCSDISIKSRLLLFLGALGVCIVMLFAGAQGASATTFGIMSGDNSWQEENGWNGIQHSGATVFRAGIAAWQFKSSFWWSKVERMFELAAQRNITILPYLYGRGNGSQQFLTTKEWGEENNAWEQFVSGVVQEFGNKGLFWALHPNLPYKPVTAWEVWNEPNLLANNPGGTTVQPTEYARFLQHTATVIQGAQEMRTPGSGTQVLFGGLYSNGNMSVTKFLEEAHSVSGTGSYFSGLSLHPYSFTSGTWGVEQYVKEARNALNSKAVQWSGKSIWITEIGWNIEPWGDKKRPAVFEDQQKSYLESSFNWLKSVEGSYNIPVVVWYIYRDNPCPEATSGEWDHHTGLIRADGTFRPAWDAFQAETGATPWHGDPYSWHTETLCGGGISDPDISTSGSDHLDVFEQGPNHDLLHRSTTGPVSTGGNGWGTWQSMGGYLTSGPGAAFSGNGVTQVSALGLDSSVWHWVTMNGWNSAGEGFTGTVTSDPDMSSWGPGRVDVFARGPENALLHRYWAGTTWSAWENLGGNLTSAPSAVSWGPNRIDVVADGPNNTVLSWYYDGTWHTGPNLAPGVPTSAPDIAATAPGKLTVVVRGSDNALWLTRYDSGAGGWASGWERIPDSQEMISGPGIVSWGNSGRLDVVARNSEWNLVHFWWGPSGAELLPKGWHAENMGGEITEDPDIASWGPNRLDIFARAPDGSYAHRWLSGGYWSGWENMASPGTIASGVGAVGSGGVRIDALGRTSSNNVVDLRWTGASWVVDSFEGEVAGDPDMAVAEGHYDMFARGTSGNLMHKYWTGSAWSSWQNMGVPIASSPGAVSWGASRIDVVARAADNTVTDTWWNGSTWQTANLGGNIVGSPDIASWGPNHLDVFARGPENTLMHKSYDLEHGWGAWENFGGTLASSPGAVSWGNGRIDVVARATDNSVLRWWWNNGQ